MQSTSVDGGLIAHEFLFKIFIKPYNFCDNKCSLLQFTPSFVYSVDYIMYVSYIRIKICNTYFLVVEVFYEF